MPQTHYFSRHHFAIKGSIGVERRGYYLTQSDPGKL